MDNNVLLFLSQNAALTIDNSLIQFESLNLKVCVFQGQILARCAALNPRTRQTYTIKVRFVQDNLIL